jgi:ABC-type dipeptide/oligopeptide/nickel transport system permease subunit
MTDAPDCQADHTRHLRPLAMVGCVGPVQDPQRRLVRCSRVLVHLLAVTIGPLLWTIEPTFIDIRARNSGPTLAHPFGTDQLGRDILARMMAGGQVSIAVGLTAMLISVLLGA